jgi:hypothetical protein
MRHRHARQTACPEQGAFLDQADAAAQGLAKAAADLSDIALATRTVNERGNYQENVEQVEDLLEALHLVWRLAQQHRALLHQADRCWPEATS